MNRVLLAFLVVLLSVQVAQAGRLRKAVPIHVRMVTYVGEKPPNVRTEFSWVVGFEKKRHQLHIAKLIVLTGTTTPLAIDSAIRPYAVQFQLVGERNAVQQFLSTPTGQPVQISAYLRIDRTSRYLMLDSVTAAPTTTPGKD